MSADLRAAVERVRNWLDYGETLGTPVVSIRAICDFAAARLGEPAQGKGLHEICSGCHGTGCDVCDDRGSVPSSAQPTPPEPPADLVEVVADVLLDEHPGIPFDACRNTAEIIILAALSGRLLKPGHVAVPVEDLHVALTLAADSSPSTASSLALNRLCDAIAAARNAATPTKERADDPA